MKATVVVIIGIAGAGKTTVGQLVAAELGWAFLDADSPHPPANIDKMTKGIQLTDADRVPWLAAVKNCFNPALVSQGSDSPYSAWYSSSALTLVAEGAVVD